MFCTRETASILAPESSQNTVNLINNVFKLPISTGQTIIYTGSSTGVEIYLNQADNGFSDRKLLSTFGDRGLLVCHFLEQVELLDFVSHTRFVNRMPITMGILMVMREYRGFCDGRTVEYRGVWSVV